MILYIYNQKKKEEIMSNVFFIADTHFYHTNILNLENRPFNTVEEMNNTLVKNWNSVVTKRDKVFILGDFSLLPPEKCQDVFNSLNGSKILVKGNHDGRKTERFLNLGFKEVYSYPVLYDQKYLLSHRPILDGKYVNLYGHVHSNPEYETWSPLGACFSAERHNYTPVSFETVKSYYC